MKKGNPVIHTILFTSAVVVMLPVTAIWQYYICGYGECSDVVFFFFDIFRFFGERLDISLASMVLQSTWFVSLVTAVLMTVTRRYGNSIAIFSYCYLLAVLGIGIMFRLFW